MAPEQTVTFPESAEWPVPDQLAGEERHTPASREGAGPGHPVRVAGVGVAAGRSCAPPPRGSPRPQSPSQPGRSGQGTSWQAGAAPGTRGQRAGSKGGRCPGQGDGHDVCGAASP